MRIALAQLNPIIGDIAGNQRKIADMLDRARDADADLLITPELAILGYPPRDLLLKPRIIEQCVQAVEQLAGRCTDIAALIGYPCPNGQSQGRPLHNAAAFCAKGRIVQTHTKRLLPTYDVFDEHRYFEPGADSQPVMHHGAAIGVTLCEDLWNDASLFERRLYHLEPIEQLVADGAEILVNCSASPFVHDKHAFRQKLFRSAAKRAGRPLLFCNQVGGNDELVFDGNSCAYDGQGELIAQARDFDEDLLIVDLDNPADNRVESPKTDIESIYHALVLGLRDYAQKCGFDTVVLGLSGGVDSAVTAALCVAALGADCVRGAAMPSRYSSEHSLDDARELAKRLKMQLDVIPIDPAHRAFETMLAQPFADQSPGVAQENIQARIRGNLLMAMSNQFGSLLVTTGNKSELAVGYCTLYGDMCGGLAVLSDVPKTLVWRLARWINDSPDSPLAKQFAGPVIPKSTLTKPPSAELRPDQLDQDTLPPYDILDVIIERCVEREQSAAQITAETGYDADMVARMIQLIDRNEYKRKQAAPGVKVTGRAFGVGRRMPIAQRSS